MTGPVLRVASARGAASRRGFTMVELLLAISVFSILGTFVVYMMRQGLGIFATGTTESSLQDRTETMLPRIVRDFEGLAIPASFDPPPPPPTEEEKLQGHDRPPPPPEDVRLRACWITLRDVPEGPLKSLPAWYMAWTTDISEDRSDPWIRRAGERSGPDLKDLEPAELDKATLDTAFRPTGGLREICYVAVPEDERFPGLLTVYRGWRSPVGGPRSLLDPKNLDSREQIHERCSAVATGVLYLGATWRRVFARSWEPTSGPVRETEAYVGPIWDSTRGLDRQFPLFAGPESLGDPSDDVFPAWVRLETTLVAPTALGLGRGDTALVDDIARDATAITVEDALPLVGPGPDERWLKVDGEWMRYRPLRVDLALGKIPVERGQRGTPAMDHDAASQVYVGLSTSATVKLLFHDRFARGASR